METLWIIRILKTFAAVYVKKNVSTLKAVFLNVVGAKGEDILAVNLKQMLVFISLL